MVQWYLEDDQAWIDPVTVARTHIVRGEAKITAALLEHIDAAHLPTEYGGQSTVALGQGRATLAELVQRLNVSIQVLLRRYGLRPFSVPRTVPFCTSSVSTSDLCLRPTQASNLAQETKTID